MRISQMFSRPGVQRDYLEGERDIFSVSLTWNSTVNGAYDKKDKRAQDSDATCRWQDRHKEYTAKGLDSKMLLT